MSGENTPHNKQSKTQIPIPKKSTVTVNPRLHGIVSVDLPSMSNGKGHAPIKENATLRLRNAELKRKRQGARPQSPHERSLTPKRNPSVFNRRCNVNFSEKVDTRFGFKNLSSPRGQEVHKFTAKSDTKGYFELKKSEQQLQVKVENLEQKLKSIEEVHQEAIDKLRISQKNLEDTNVEKLQLEERLSETESTKVLEEAKLKNKLDKCEKKLLLSNINPVTLERLGVDETEEETRKKNVLSKVAALKERMVKVKASSDNLLDAMQELRVTDTSVPLFTEDNSVKNSDELF